MKTNEQSTRRRTRDYLSHERIITYQTEKDGFCKLRRAIFRGALNLLQNLPCLTLCRRWRCGFLPCDLRAAWTTISFVLRLRKHLCHTSSFDVPWHPLGCVHRRTLWRAFWRRKFWQRRHPVREAPRLTLRATGPLRCTTGTGIVQIAHRSEMFDTKACKSSKLMTMDQFELDATEDLMCHRGRC